jgi:hypothetical protein
MAKPGRQVAFSQYFSRTNEVSIDPVSNKKLRVYFNEKTGERFYLEE